MCGCLYLFITSEQMSPTGPSYSTSTPKRPDITKKVGGNRPVLETELQLAVNVG